MGLKEMTGIERLCELADAVTGSVWANTSSNYCKKYGLSVDNTGGSFRDFLRQIADQIVNERLHDMHIVMAIAIDRAMAMRAVSKSIDWAVSDGIVSSADMLGWQTYLEKKADCVTEEALGEDIDVIRRGAFSLLSKEDREAVEWVRSKGGLGAVKKRWGDSVPLDVYRRKKDNLLGHIDECETALRKRKQRIEDLGRLIQSRNDEWAMVHNEFEHMRLDHIEGLAFEKLVDDIAARLGVSVMGFDSQDTRDRIMPVLERRLMPEGMEWLLEVWPKWSNGEYCKFGDWWTADKYGYYEPRQLRRLVFYTPEQLREWGQDEGDNFGYEWDFMRPLDTTYRPDKAEPPAHKVLAADGEEIRAGEMLFHVMSGDGVTARQLMPPDKFEDTEFVQHFASEYTHRAPVLAADGSPLREGETVYKVGGDGTAYVFDGMSDNVDGLAMLHHDGKPYIGTGIRVDQITHERHDSWERLEEDAAGIERDCGGTWHKPDGSSVNVVDLVRRAQALAERGK